MWAVFNLFKQKNKVDEKIRQQRLNVCFHGNGGSPCSHLTKANRCDLCGCFVKQKSKLKPEKGGICDAGYWKN